MVFFHAVINHIDCWPAKAMMVNMADGAYSNVAQANVLLALYEPP